MSIRRDRINRKRNSRVLGLVIVSLLAVAAILIIYSIIVVVRSFTSGAAPEVTVPNLAGLPVEEAEGKLNALNLGLEIVENAPSDKYPAGAIVSQMPIAGAVVRENKQVKVIRSLGKASLTVPKVIGLSFDNAQRKIAEAGLTLGVVQKIYTKKFARGSVITQVPDPEKVFTSPVKVDVTIAFADGDYKATMPALVGKDFRTAENMLYNLNLLASKVTYEMSSSAGMGEVIKQKPEAGTALSPGSGVELTVAISAVMAKKDAQDFRFTFRLPSGLPAGKLRVEIEDDLGKQNAYTGDVEPGDIIEQQLHVNGHAKIRVYLDGSLLREDKI